MTKIIGPEGHEYEVEEEANARILMEGLPVILGEAHEQKLTTKEGEYFVLSTLLGNIPEENYAGLGLYYKDTRFLSSYNMTICDKDPVLLSSSMETDYLSLIEMTNAELVDLKGRQIKQQTVNIKRRRVMRNGMLEQFEITNYNDHPMNLSLELTFGSDFADIFEVRGYRRTSRGTILKPKLIDGRVLVLAYQGEDEQFRSTIINLPSDPITEHYADGHVILGFQLVVKPRSVAFADISVAVSDNGTASKLKDFATESRNLKMIYSLWEKNCTDFFSDNEIFNTVVRRSQNDLRALCSRTDEGFIIEAGVPWFSTIFGRDSIIASIQTLAFNAEVARATILCLASYQGKKVDEWRDEEPGKILHELRRGELAKLNVIPHTPYYGSVDSTPLFLILVWEYFKWTNDLKLIERILPNIEKALDWIDKYGDIDKDGFVEYHRKSPKGLVNQGWKDSFNAVCHADGRIAEAPIALAEVQGYTYAGKRYMARIFRILGKTRKAESLERSAAQLKQKFNDLFWMEKEQFFAMALDGEKKQIQTITSNPGHCLWTSIVDEDKAALMAKKLTSREMFSGWGIRTVGKNMRSYNPMSYHNGSVWPHDNSIIIAGFKKYKLDQEVNLVATGLFDSAIHHAYFRLPELFCGFTRRENNWPVNYPVACSPQAWAAGSVFLLLQSIIGFKPDAPNNTLYVSHPLFPVWLNKMSVKNLRIGNSFVDLNLSRVGKVTALTVVDKQGDVKLVMEE